MFLFGEVSIVSLTQAGFFLSCLLCFKRSLDTVMIQMRVVILFFSNTLL